MADKHPFHVHIAETQHYEFEVWAADEEAAREMARNIWCRAATTGQWQIPDTDTEYSVTKKTA